MTLPEPSFESPADPEPLPKKSSRLRQFILRWGIDILLIYVLLAGAYLRFSGIFWGEYQYLHPDERFLVWVGSDISPVKSLGEFFDTANSSLNPHNRGHGFYVYGTLPMFITRYVVEWVFGNSGFMEMTQAGRALSALADLLTVLLVFLVGARLYDRRVGVLAAAFSAAAVLHIQQSHFFTMDTFINMFTLLAFYFAVQVSKTDWKDWRRPLFYSLGFGLAFGMAMASKVSAIPMAMMLPAAVALRLFTLPAKDRQDLALHALGYMAVAAFVSLLVFRLGQPYAFSGPGFLGLAPNERWVANLKELRAQSSGDVDFPPALQWARRSILFSGKNMVQWGLGLAFGLLAWGGFIWAGLRMLKGDWARHALIWGWTAFYFTWQSLASNPTMRYQFPVYPMLAIFAGWALLAWYEQVDQPDSAGGGVQPPSRGRRLAGWLKRHSHALATAAGVLALSATWIYAVAFTTIYTRPITRVEASRWIYQNIPGPINLHLRLNDNTLLNQPLPFPYDLQITPAAPYLATFRPNESGVLEEILLSQVTDLQADHQARTLSLSITDRPDGEPLAQASLMADFSPQEQHFGPSRGYTLKLDRPLSMEKDKPYFINLKVENNPGSPPLGMLAITGMGLANEGEWDDGLPLRMDGYDGFGGIYPLDLNFNMYWDDTPEKRDRFSRILDESDYIVITSNRQWGSLPRIPERFPLTTQYYRELLGCPIDKDIYWCYAVAEPGQFKGRLGYELVKVFQSDPAIGSWHINDQFAEEAFTVYDHPKVLVFQKTNSYDPQHTREALGAADLEHIVRLPPLRYGPQPANLLLPPDRLEGQRGGGTWSELFKLQALQNRWPIASIFFWYLSITLLGLLAYPLVRLALPGLGDRGYPMSRTFGLLSLSYLCWLAGSYKVPFTRFTITLALLIIAAAGLLLAYVQREELKREWKEKKRYFLMIELVALGFFLLDLLIRYGNPDLWHPWKGGEKPMDFSYFNAVLKSTTFPPYDPWFAGGYLNYYYFGFVFVGTLVKWLGIVPAVAYNLIIPTIFSFIALGAFSLAWNLADRVTFWLPQPDVPARDEIVSQAEGERPHSDRNDMQVVEGIPHFQFWIGMAGALGMSLLGNLGTVRMIIHGWQRLVAPGGLIDDGSFFDRLIWTFQGFSQVIMGAKLPYSIGDWYWIPSRAIPAPNDVEPITEFPFFTVLYADLHAHLFALPMALLVLAFALSVVLSAHASGRRWKSWLGVCAGFLLAGLAAGALRPTNTWDFYPYLAIGVIALGYGLWFSLDTGHPLVKKIPGFCRLPGLVQKLGLIAASAALFVGLSILLYRPYTQWYLLGYSKPGLWTGTHTPLASYLVHWGLFLFIIVTWMLWETIEWMAATPLVSLRKLEKFRGLIGIAGILLLVTAASLMYLGARIAWLVLPLAAWAGVLLLRPDQTDGKRFVLFLTGTGLVLTLMVEVIVLVGDIGRMNTVFKFYLQVWTFFSICAAAGLGWLLTALPRWRPQWRLSWEVALMLLALGAALYPVTAAAAKVRDRMTEGVPHTLDGMEFMKYSHYQDEWGDMDLGQDYLAIRWLQDHVQGSPVIVEANLRNLYRWGSRMSIYTGLPGVVGWEWHQQQQRAKLPGDWVSRRIAEIADFYKTTDLGAARQFLQKYDVRYIILGQQEMGMYPGPGLDKFPAAEGVLWRRVYQDGNTSIYETLR